MPRGHRVERVVDRANACANCGLLRFLEYPEITEYGISGIHFCRLVYGETGDFVAQPWDFTCDDFKNRVRRHNKDKCVEADAVPVVTIPKGWDT